MTELGKAFAQSRNSQRQTVERNNMRATRPRIGQIMIEAGMVTSDNLHHALKLAEESKQPVGRMLIGLGYVKERDLQAALLAQSLVGDGVLNEQTAFAAARHAHKNAVSLTEAVNLLDDNSSKIDDGGLGGLLVNSGMVTRESYENCKAHSEESGMTLGRIMLLTSHLTVPMLDSALSVMALLRDGLITKQQAVSILREVRRSHTSVKEALCTLRINLGQNVCSAPKLGELLCRSKAITEQEMVTAVESAMTKGKLIGEELISIGAVSAEVIANAVKIQGFLNCGILSEEQARNALAAAITERIPATEVASRTGMLTDSHNDAIALELCKLSRLVSSEAITVAEREMAQYGMGQAKAVLATEYVSRSTFLNAIILAEMIENKLLEPEQGISALLFCNKSDIDADLALAKMGIVVTKPESTAPQKDTNAEKVKKTLSAWADAEELRNLFVFMVVVTGLAVIAVRLLHIELPIVGAVTLAAFSALFIKYGRAFQKRQWDGVVAEQLRMVNAQSTKERLSRKGSPR